MGKNHKIEANRLIALLSITFNKAIEFGLWDNPNPALGIKKFREKSRDRFLQSEELPQFFTELAKEPKETIRDYILLAILTGARRSNLLAMRWEEISWARAEWRIPITKNGDPQTVTLSEEAVIILKSHQKTATNEYVFPGNGRSGHLAEPKKGWWRVLKEAKIENLRIHDFTPYTWQLAGKNRLLFSDYWQIS